MTAPCWTKPDRESTWNWISCSSPAGIFQMGGAAVACEGPVRKVMVVPFSIGRSLVSRGAYQRFLDENPGEPLPRFWETPPSRGPGAPVVGVSWV